VILIPTWHGQNQEDALQNSSAKNQRGGAATKTDSTADDADGADKKIRGIRVIGCISLLRAPEVTAAYRSEKRGLARSGIQTPRLNPATSFPTVPVPAFRGPSG